MPEYTLHFETELRVPPAAAWGWATSAAGILAELAPLARMTLPRGMTNLMDVDTPLGEPIVRSWVLLFGVLPIDRSDLTLIELEPGRRFLEESPMLSMRRWRHERTIEAAASGGSTLRDELRFAPRFAGPIVRAFISTLFRNRHRVLARQMGA